MPELQKKIPGTNAVTTRYLGVALPRRYKTPEPRFTCKCYNHQMKQYSQGTNAITTRQPGVAVPRRYSR